MKQTRRKNPIKQDTEKDISKERQTDIEMSVLSRMASDKYDELKLRYNALELAYESLSRHLNIGYRALYSACADIYSIKYPNTAKSIDELMNQYIEDAEREEDYERT